MKTFHSIHTVANGSLFHDVKFLANVHEASTRVTIQGITGKMSTRLIGDNPGLLTGIGVNIAASLNIICAAGVVEYVVARIANQGKVKSVFVDLGNVFIDGFLIRLLYIARQQRRHKANRFQGL